MTDVEKVALWAGLIASIVSIALSIVATVFAVLVNNRSEKVSDQTIKSLQKIESAVERLSGDTTGLIKAAWDTMLGSFSGRVPRDSTVSSTAAHEIASGLAAEVRSNIGLENSDTKGTSVKNLGELSERIDDALNKLETTLAGQLRTLGRQTRPAVVNKVRALEGLSLPAQQLAASIKAHLTREQYNALEKGPLAEAVHELREAGLLVPLTGEENGKEVPVYHFPPGQWKTLKSALLLLEQPPSEVKQMVQSALDDLGYDPHRFD